MADDLTLNAGSGGATLATDEDAGSRHYQLIKLADGTANSTTVVATGTGTATNGLRVALADSSSVAATNAGTFAVQADSVIPGTGATNLGKAEDAVHSSGDTGVMALAVRNDTLAALAGTDGDYAPLQVDAGGALYTHDQNKIDANNSTTSTLTGGATYTGTGTDVSQYSCVTIQIFADVDSATDGMRFEFSTDNSNWDDTYSFTMDVSASNTRRFQFPVTAQYFRVRYTNGAGAQSAFRVQTILHAQNALTSVHRLVDNTSPDRSAQVVKAALIAQASGSGNFVPVAANAGGKLQVAADTGLDTDIATLAGAVSGTEMQVDVVAALPAGTNAIGKLAANSGVDIGDVDVTSISAGSNLIGDVGISGARTSGGTTLYRNVDVDETEDQVKGGAGQVYWIHAMNLTAAVLYLQIYNATAASVTVGTTTPDLTFPLATQGDTNGAGFTFAIPNGIAFGTAITIACTTTIGGSSGPAANGCVVNLGYA